MKKLFLSVCLLFAAVGFLHAQNTTIDLQLPVTQQILPPGNIQSINVIINLDDTSIIGVLPSASPNVRTNVVIEQGVQAWLQQYTNQEFGNSYQQIGNKILWIVKQLRIGKDSSANGATSFTKLTADIYWGMNNSYQFFSTFDTLMITNNLNTDFGQYLATAVNRLYTTSAAISVSQNKTLAQKIGKPIKKSALIASINTDSIKILLDTAYNTGVFLNFHEFANDAPSIEKFYTSIDTATNKVQLYQMMEDSSGRLIPQAWGICINNELYRYKNGQLYAIEKVDNSFALSKYVDYQVRKNQALFWRRYIGENQGGANPFDDQHIYRAPIVEGSNASVEATLIDMNSGEITSY